MENFVNYELPAGWELEGGSYGTVKIDVASVKWKVDHNWRTDDDFDGEDLDDEFDDEDEEEGD